MKGKGLLSKIFILLFVCMLLPLLVLSTTNYYVTYRQLYNNLVNATQDDTGNIAYYLTMEFSEYFNTCYYISQNKDLQNIVKDYYFQESSLDNILSQVDSLLTSPSMVERVKYPFEYFLLLGDGHMVTRYNHSGEINYNHAREKIEKADWYKKINEISSENVLVFLEKDYVNTNGGYKIYIARKIEQLENEGAVFVIGIDQYLINRLLDNYQPTTDSSIFLYTDQECLAYGENNKISILDVERMYEEEWNQEAKMHGELVKELKTEELFNMKSFYFSDMPDSIWNVMVITPTKAITKSIQYIKWTTIVLIFLCIGCSGVFFYLAKKYIFDRVIVLKKALAEVGEGNMEVRLLPGKDEIGDLYQGFNEMTVALKKAEEKARKEEKKKISLELSMLQSQITPHFIRNTLNSIRWMAEILKEEGISRALLSLMRLIDYNIRDVISDVTIEDELNNLNEYINIEKMRYGNKFTYSTEVEPEILNQKTLKLLLQPIVENCIMHGFKNIDTLGSIHIIGKVENSGMIIVVEDNGTGMSKETMERILHPDDSSQCSRIGIYNVNRRIQYQFGDKYGIELKQKEPHGTRVEILLPYYPEE